MSSVKARMTPQDWSPIARELREQADRLRLAADALDPKRNGRAPALEQAQNGRSPRKPAAQKQHDDRPKARVTVEQMREWVAEKGTFTSAELGEFMGLSAAGALFRLRPLRDDGTVTGPHRSQGRGQHFACKF